MVVNLSPSSRRLPHCTEAISDMNSGAFKENNSTSILFMHVLRFDFYRL